MLRKVSLTGLVVQAAVLALFLLNDSMFLRLRYEELLHDLEKATFRVVVIRVEDLVHDMGRSVRGEKRWLGAK